MPPKSRPERRKSFSEEETAKIIKAHPPKDAYEKSSLEIISYKQDTDGKDNCKPSSLKKIVHFGEINIRIIPNREEIAEADEYEIYKANILNSLRRVDLSPGSIYNDTEANNTSLTLTRTRSTSFYIPPNQTFAKTDREDDEESLPFAIAPNIGEGQKLIDPFIEYG